MCKWLTAEHLAMQTKRKVVQQHMKKVLSTSLSSLTGKLSPKRLQLGQFIMSMNNSHGHVWGFCFFSHLCWTLEKPCTEGICKTTVGFNGGNINASAGCCAVAPGSPSTGCQVHLIKSPATPAWVTEQITPSVSGTPNSGGHGQHYRAKGSVRPGKMSTL